MHTNRTRTRTILLSLSAVGALTLVASGCGKSPSELVAEKVIEQQTDGDVDVDFDSGEINIETPDGNVTMDEDGNFTLTDGSGEEINGAADEDGNYTVEGEDGSFSMSQDGTIPEEWPDDVPKPDLALTGSSVLDTGEGDGITLVGTVDDGVDFIASYGADLEDAGLAKMSDYSTQESASAIFGNDSWTMSVGAAEYGDEMQVSITLYPTG